MKKNVAGQFIGAQMVSATDGSEFTGAVTVYVTGDAGAQAIGSVGAGVCTHEGHGYHTYAPAQAETNYDLIAFTFIGTGAVPASIQTPTTFPQTGDTFARIGAAGAGLTAIGDTRLAQLDAAVSTRSVFAGGAVASVTGAVGSVAGSVAGSVGSVVGNIGGNLLGALTSAERSAIADALLDEANGVEGGRTLRQWFRLAASVLFQKGSGLNTNTPKYRDAADTKDRVAAITDANGNRIAVTLDAT